jgi:hypothetical protein
MTRAGDDAGRLPARGGAAQMTRASDDAERSDEKERRR